MNLSHLTDEALHQETAKIIKQERHLLTTLIHHLRENLRRRLYAARKCESLKDYLVFELGLSDDQAWRRIDAITLLEELPELEEKIHQGLHNLTHLNLAHAVFKKEAEFAERPFSRQDKLDVMNCIEGLPTRHAGRMLLKFSTVPREVAKEGHRELTMDAIANHEGIQFKLKRLKGLLAHSDKGISDIEIISKLCDLGLETWDPALKKVRKKRSHDPAAAQEMPSASPQAEIFSESDTSAELPTSAAPRDFDDVQNLSFAQKERIVWQRANSQCENCKSYYALQIEHSFPKALGGTDDLENLKLLCRSCNQRRAIEMYGLGKMDKYLSPEGRL